MTSVSGYSTSISAWQQVQNNRSTFAASRAQFEDSMSSMSDALTSAITSQASGMATLAGQQALDRINAATKAVQQKNGASSDGTAAAAAPETDLASIKRAFDAANTPASVTSASSSASGSIVDQIVAAVAAHQPLSSIVDLTT